MFRVVLFIIYMFVGYNNRGCKKQTKLRQKNNTPFLLFILYYY